MNTRRTKQTLLVAVGLLGFGGLFVATASPAQADPPRHAPANGWRRNQDRDNDRWDRRDNRRDNDRWDNRRNDRDRRDWGWSRDRDRDGIPNYRDRWDNRDSWRRIDSDRDGIPNYRDRFPHDRRRS